MILVNRFLFIQKALFVLSFCAISSSLMAERDSLKYEITTGWIGLGQLSLTWENRNDSLLIHSTSQATFSYLFGKREMVYDINLLLLSGTLVHSFVNVYENKELTEYTYTTKDKNGYSVTKKEKEKDEINTKLSTPEIRWTTTMLLFNQPNGNEQVYAELHSVLGRIELTEKNEFFLINNKTNKKTWYKYDSGVLQSSRMTHPIMDFKLNRIKP